MKKFNELNRALIKRFELLPNIFEFKTEKYSIHEFAAIYGIEKILRRTQAEKLLVSKPNRYLERQYHRLTQYAANGQIAEFNYLSALIISKSISYRILALNRTIADWHILPIRTLRRIWRSLSFISRTLSSDLKFKRVWIDKKPGDYARPLGVPTPAWRCYSFMWMDHIERFFKASGKLATWQHGGRSGVGVLSCYKALIPRLKTSKFIYEFDIKGFFDNISHESIIQKFKENMYNKSPTTTWITQILKAQPTSYTLPPIEQDKATLIYLENQKKYETIKRLIESVRAEYYEILDSKGKIIWGSSSRVPNLRALRAWSVRYAMVMNEISYLESNLGVDRYVYDGPRQLVKQLKILAKIQTGNLFQFVDYPIDLMNKYSDIMKTEYVTRVKGLNIIAKPVLREDREKGRDKWKNLGQEGKGVPQGLNTSPFISTVMTDSAFYDLGLWDAILMYMDDGLLFAETREELERNILLLKEGLKGLGLEMEVSKSGLVKEDDKWLKSLKFLGLRYLPEEDTLMSDTRSGTKVIFPPNANWDDIKLLAGQNQLSVPYMRKLFDKLINTQAYETGLKYGFLGCLIAGSQYREALSMTERKEEIRKGQNRAWAEIEGSRGFIWKHQDLLNYPETLTNVSSIASHKFAEFNRLGYKLHIRCGSKIRRGGRI